MSYQLNLDDVSISNCEVGLSVSDASEFRGGKINVENASNVGISVSNVKNVHIKSVAIRNTAVGIEFKAPSDSYLNLAESHLDKIEFDKELKIKLLEIMRDAKESEKNVDKISVYERIVALSANHVTALSPVLTYLYAWATTGTY